MKITAMMMILMTDNDDNDIENGGESRRECVKTREYKLSDDCR